jgi:guanylate kinase
MTRKDALRAEMPAASGLLLVISAPSGAGKTSLVNALVRGDSNIVVSVSHTTRPKRASETDGSDYHFVTQDRFEEMCAAGQFLEHAEVFGHFYGTAQPYVETHLRAGRDVLLEIDWQGARQVREHYVQAVSLFILPPSRQALAERLRKRGLDGEAVIAERTAKAVAEMSHHDEYDYLVVNDVFEQALSDIEGVVRAERQRTVRQRNRLGTLLRELLS